MKKILSILTAGLLLLSASLVTSCSEEDVEYLAPSGTWCEMPVDWDGDGSSNMYVAVIYNEEKISGTSTGSANLKSGLTFDPGITIVVFAKAEISTFGLTAGTYTYKTFPKDSDIVADDDDSSYTFKGSRAKWAAIYWAKSDLRDTNSQSVHPKAPSAITNGNSYTPLTGDALETFKNNFSWKKLLANYLLNSL